MHDGVLIAGTGPWSDALDSLLLARGIRCVRVTNRHEMSVAARHLRPTVAILGPSLSHAEIVRGIVDVRDARHDAWLVVALDRQDREFETDLLALSIPSVAFVPAGLTCIADDVARVAAVPAAATAA